MVHNNLIAMLNIIRNKVIDIRLFIYSPLKAIMIRHIPEVIKNSELVTSGLPGRPPTITVSIVNADIPVSNGLVLFMLYTSCRILI